MLSQGATYALRAVLHLAATGKESASVDEIAEALGMNPSYLAKVLQTLAREGVLASERGRRGGFRLAVAPHRLKLARVVGTFDPDTEKRFCLLRLGPCSDRTACAAHHAWKATADNVAHFFRTTSVADLIRDRADTASWETRSSPGYAAIP